MTLRELTENEKAELNRIKVSGSEVGYQILLGMIAIDLMQDGGAYGHPLTPEEFRECVVDTDNYSKKDQWVFPCVVNTWSIKLSGYTGGHVTQKMRDNWVSLTFALIDTLCGMYSCMYGKKYKKMMNFYKEQDALFLDQYGKSIDNSSEYVYRFIMACIEFMGYTREPSLGDEYVDVSKIPFLGFVQ